MTHQTGLENHDGNSIFLHWIILYAILPIFLQKMAFPAVSPEYGTVTNSQSYDFSLILVYIRGERRKRERWIKGRELI